MFASVFFVVNLGAPLLAAHSFSLAEQAELKHLRAEEEYHKIALVLAHS